MFICNIKMNSGFIKKLAIIIVVLIMVVVFITVGRRFYESTSRVIVNDNMSNSELYNSIVLNSSNYTSFLKECHENIDVYVGKSFKFTGFVYRLYDFNENQFVLAREMVISSDNQAVVVGILCNSNASIQYANGTWIEVEGTIVKGDYHGERPVIEVTSIKETNVPNDELVYPPSDGYVETEI